MNEQFETPETYAFGPYTISASERVLRYNDRPVVLAAKAIDCLLVLAAARDRVISKHELMERVWPSADVDEANLTQTIYLLRRTFKHHQTHVAIENIPKRGYRLTASLEAAPPALHAATAARPRRAGIAIAGAVAVALSAAMLFFVSSHGKQHEPLSGVTLNEFMLARDREDAGTFEDLQASRTLYGRVAEARPDSGLGDAGMAECDASLAFYARDERHRVALASAAITLARRSVELDPTADTYAARGGVELSIEHDDAAAAADFQRSLAMNPNQTHALLWYGALLMNHGDVGPARRMFERAVGLAPNSPGAAASLAWSDFVAGDYAAAIALSKQMLLIHQLPSLARVTLANAYLEAGDLQGARRTIGALDGDSTERYQAVALQAKLQAMTGNAASARRALHRVDETTDRRTTDGWDAASLAAAYVAIGERARAFMWLSRVDVRERGQVAMDPRFLSIRNDPEFKAWLGV